MHFCAVMLFNNSNLYMDRHNFKLNAMAQMVKDVLMANSGKILIVQMNAGAKEGIVIKVGTALCISRRFLATNSTMPLSAQSKERRRDDDRAFQKRLYRY